MTNLPLSMYVFVCVSNLLLHIMIFMWAKTTKNTQSMVKFAVI